MYSQRFGRALRRIDRRYVHGIAEREKMFLQNCFDPRLKTHKLHGALDGYWSFSLTYSHRVLFRFREKGIVEFINVGGHSIYD